MLAGGTVPEVPLLPVQFCVDMMRFGGYDMNGMPQANLTVSELWALPAELADEVRYVWSLVVSGAVERQNREQRRAAARRR